jgi:glutaredoxin
MRERSASKNPGNTNPKIIIYTTSDCDFSRHGKKHLNLCGYEFEERNITEKMKWLQEMLEISNSFSGTPVIRIDKADEILKVIKGLDLDELDKTLSDFQNQPEQM